MLLDPLVGDEDGFVTFYVAIAAAAWYGGLGPALVVLPLGVLSADYFFIPPRYELGITLPHHLVDLAGYLTVGLAIALFSEATRSARRRAEAQAAELRRRRSDLEREVAERKRLQDEIQQSARQLADADHRKDEFLAMLAHELRGPLGAVGNALHVLRLAGASAPEQYRSVDVIARQARQMGRLVEDLLDVSRIGRGKLTLRRERVSLADVIGRAVETCRPFVEERRHGLKVTLPPGPVWLTADPARMCQVFTNLLTNAAKYTEAGGRIGLAAQRSDHEVVVRVSDNGVGIRPEVLPYVFEPFVQAEGARGLAEDGLGLGLALVKRLVEMHGGRVEAHSDGPGTGTEFRVRLPADLD
jgi:signal transduction histidine kinase